MFDCFRPTEAALLLSGFGTVGECLGLSQCTADGLH